MNKIQPKVDFGNSSVVSRIRDKGRRYTVRFVSTFKAAFEVPKVPQQEPEKTCDLIDRVVVGARSHGNMRLQHGLYYTRRDLDAEYDRVRKINFSE